MVMQQIITITTKFGQIVLQIDTWLAKKSRHFNRSAIYMVYKMDVPLHGTMTTTPRFPQFSCILILYEP